MSLSTLHVVWLQISHMYTKWKGQNRVITSNLGWVHHQIINQHDQSTSNIYQALNPQLDVWPTVGIAKSLSQFTHRNLVLTQVILAPTTLTDSCWEYLGVCPTVPCLLICYVQLWIARSSTARSSLHSGHTSTILPGFSIIDGMGQVVRCLVHAQKY